MTCLGKLMAIIALAFFLVDVYFTYSIVDSVLDFFIGTFFLLIFGVFCFGAAASMDEYAKELDKKCRKDDD